jgi:DNA-binding transcriptional ArsR family regulator
MRALAHPMRLALLEALRREGSLTATRAAELLDDSPGNMSWHLQTLAKYGFVEEAGGGRGRSRPWRVVPLVLNIEAVATGDPATEAAGEALEATLQQHNDRRLHEWWSQRRSYSEQWRRSAFYSGGIGYLTAGELHQLSEEVNHLLMRYQDRAQDKSLRPADALPVQFVAYAHPVPTTVSGN